MKHTVSIHKTVLIMAGGTGGHIMPGLAVAKVLQDQGHTVVWLGGAASAEKIPMEAQLVPKTGLEYHGIPFSGVRGKGGLAKFSAPLKLVKALWQARAVYRVVRPDVVLGMGGYITVPGGLAAKMTGIPVVVHEQNSVAGMANKLLAKFAAQVLTGFPMVFAKGVWVGNPVKQAIAAIEPPELRYAQREGQLKIAVIGGSLGAQALNTIVPQALALLSPDQRPTVVHQSGQTQIDALIANYQQAGVEAECVAFVDDMAALYRSVDLVICRSGAMTVAELAAAGVASILVPYPHAVDDHQTANAAWLVKEGAATLLAQSELTAQGLASQLRSLTRSFLAEQAGNARRLAKTDAAHQVASMCLQSAGVPVLGGGEKRLEHEA